MSEYEGIADKAVKLYAVKNAHIPPTKINYERNRSPSLCVLRNT